MRIRVCFAVATNPVEGVVESKVNCQVVGLSSEGCQYTRLQAALSIALSKLLEKCSGRPPVDFEISFAVEGEPIFPLECPVEWHWPLTKVMVIAMAQDEFNSGFWSRWEAMLSGAVPS